MDEKTFVTQKNTEDRSAADSTDISGDTVDCVTQESTEVIDQISKSVTVGSKEVYYEDGRNVISVIINAISVRINMPRGTVKLLMACFVVLLAAASVYGVNVLRDWSTSYYETAEYQKAVDDIKFNAIKGAHDVSSIDLSRRLVLPEKEVVISENYSFTVPAGYFDEYTFGYGELFMNMQSYGFYNSDGDYFAASCYITKEGISDKDMQTIVMDRLKDAVDVRNIRCDRDEFEFGDLVVLRFEAFETGKPSLYAVEYSWQDDDGTVCSLEVFTDTGNLEETAKQVLSSVHRSENGLTNDELIARDRALYAEGYTEGYDADDPAGMDNADPFEAMAPDVDEIRKQEAMDAWKEYSNPEQPPDISDRTIKP